ncbi:MAG: hypothetical protein ACRDOL_22620 [Streptosporangiaceae bacterium]
MTAGEFPAASSAAVIRPGDTLILGFSRHLERDECESISERASAELPGVVVAVIDQLAHMAVYRPSAAADEPDGAPDGGRL